MADRIYLKRYYQCGYRDSIRLTVYTTHPSRIDRVGQMQSHAFSLCRDKTCFRFDVSLEYRGWNNFCSARNKVRWMWRHLWAGPWDRPKMS